MTLESRRRHRRARVRHAREITGDSPREQLRKLEWAVWDALGTQIVQDAGPRYESAEMIAAHLYVAGAICND